MPKETRIALFADGEVGKQLLDFVWTDHQATLIALVHTDEQGIVAKQSGVLGLSDVGIPVLCANTLSEADLAERLRAQRCDYFVLGWWPRIIQKQLISAAIQGVINLHPSLLPYNRGRNYNFWTIIEDSPFGVSLHFVDEGIDTGDVIAQVRIPKSWEDTGESLYLRAREEIITLFKRTYPKIITGTISATRQELGKGSFHYAKEMGEASRIDLDRSYTARELLNLIRARTFPPHPACSFEDAGERYEVTVRIRKIGKAN
jgi:methionyl-tRNA formyltransferase